MTAAKSNSAQPIPARAGIGLRGPHHAAFLDGSPAAAWLEAHSENYFAADGVALAALERIRAHYPLSLHGVGLSLGSTDELDAEHLGKLARLVDRIEPALVSEHLCWGSVGGQHLNDLLPLPYTEEAVTHLVSRIDQVQNTLRRELLIENVSGYVEFTSSSLREWEFLTSVAERSGAKILLDVNNIYVNARNHGFEANEYIDAVPARLVAEIHLAGHSIQTYDEHDILVDTHDTQVTDDVWELYERALQKIGAVPTLIEWDSQLPSVDELLAEADKAQCKLDHAHERAA